MTLSRFFIAVLLISCVLCTTQPARASLAPEILIAPRETEILTVSPRISSGKLPEKDPEWLTRGAPRNAGTYDNPLPSAPLKPTRQQLELLRGLNKLRLYESTDDLDSSDADWDHLRNRTKGPEHLQVMPRLAK